ncbi:MAG: hypothetical protein WEB06_12025 [Actinomycetota bacterium]
MLCPRCCARQQRDSGFCRACELEQSLEAYHAAEREAADERRGAWAKRMRPLRRGTSNAAILDDIVGREAWKLTEAERAARREADAQRACDAAYQRRSRLLKRLHPRNPIPPSDDPYVLGDRALSLVEDLRRATSGVNADRTSTEIRRELSELIRWLSVGPPEAPDLEAAG